MAAATAAASAPRRSRLILFLDGSEGHKGFVELLRERLQDDPKSTHDLEKFVAAFIATDYPLSRTEALSFLEVVVKPFTTECLQRTVKNASGSIAGLVAKLIVWWRNNLPQNEMLKKDMDKELFRIIVKGVKYHWKGEQVRTFEQCLTEQTVKKPSFKGTIDSSLQDLMRQATLCTNSGGCDAMFELLDVVMRHDNFNISVLFAALQLNPKSITRILELFFDPLTVAKVFTIPKHSKEVIPVRDSALIGLENAENREQGLIKVEWSDTTSDYLASGMNGQNRTKTKVVVESIISKVMTSRTCSDVLILKKVTESLAHVNLKRMSADHAPGKFAILLGEAINSTEAIQASIPSDRQATEQETSQISLSVDLSRKILDRAFEKAMMHTDKPDAFATKLFDFSMRSPNWWSQAMPSTEGLVQHSDAQAHKVTPEQQLLGFVRDLRAKFRKYVASLSQDVGLELLRVIYARSDTLHPGDACCAPWMEFLCEAVSAAESKSRLKHLSHQPQHFWNFVSEHHNCLLDAQGSELLTTRMTNVVFVLGNRTSNNVLGQLFDSLRNSLESDSNSVSEARIQFGLRMCSDNLGAVWKKSCDATTVNNLLDCSQYCLSRMCESDSPVFVNFIRKAFSLINSSVQLPRTWELKEQEAERVIACITRLWTAGKPFDASDVHGFARLVIALLSEFPASNGFVAKEISEHRNEILLVSYNASMLSWMLNLMHNADQRANPAGVAKNSSLLDAFLSALVCNLNRLQSEDDRFLARCKNLQSLLVLLDDLKIFVFVSEVLSRHLPSIFDALVSPFKKYVEVPPIQAPAFLCRRHGGVRDRKRAPARCRFWICVCHWQ